MTKRTWKVRPPGPCEIEGCDRPRRKRDWCEKHYGRWLKNGSPHDDAQSWVVGERGDCVVCGETVPAGIGFRRYCGQSCAVMAQRGARPTAGQCIKCGGVIDLTARHPSGRLKYTSATLCPGCRRERANLSPHVPALVERDGTDCPLCGEVIDLTLRYPNPMSRSVDHIIPWSKGGPNELSNYQLAHLRCNIRKQNREESARKAG